MSQTVQGLVVLRPILNHPVFDVPRDIAMDTCRNLDKFSIIDGNKAASTTTANDFNCVTETISICPGHDALSRRQAKPTHRRRPGPRQRRQTNRTARYPCKSQTHPRMRTAPNRPPGGEVAPVPRRPRLNHSKNRNSLPLHLAKRRVRMRRRFRSPAPSRRPPPREFVDAVGKSPPPRLLMLFQPLSLRPSTTSSLTPFPLRRDRQSVRMLGSAWSLHGYGARDHANARPSEGLLPSTMTARPRPTPPKLGAFPSARYRLHNLS
jgi:hypothetical protein